MFRKENLMIKDLNFCHFKVWIVWQSIIIKIQILELIIYLFALDRIENREF